MSLPARSSLQTMWAWGNPRSWYSITWMMKTVLSPPKYFPFLRLCRRAWSLAWKTIPTIAGTSKGSISSQITSLSSGHFLFTVAVKKIWLFWCSVTKCRPLIANFFKCRGLPWKLSPKNVGFDFGSKGRRPGVKGGAAAAAAAATAGSGGKKKSGGKAEARTTSSSPWSKKVPKPPPTAAAPPATLRPKACATISSGSSSLWPSSERSSITLSRVSSPKIDFLIFSRYSNRWSMARDIWSTK